MAGGTADRWPARLKNVSLAGIGLTVARRFEPRTLLAIDMDDPGQGCTRTLLARVVHATRLTDSQWLLGCNLVRELDEEELRLWGAEPVRPATPDHRAWVRVPCQVQTFCRAEAAPSLERWPTTVVNISPGGIEMLTHRPAEKGALLSVELPGVEDGPARQVLVRVVRLQAESDGQWLVGCEFAEKLDERRLQALVG
jgi:hypothetical protein